MWHHGSNPRQGEVFTYTSPLIWYAFSDASWNVWKSCLLRFHMFIISHFKTLHLALLSCYVALHVRRFLLFSLVRDLQTLAGSDGLVKHTSLTVTFPETLRSSHHFQWCHTCHLQAVTTSPRGVGSLAEVGVRFFPRHSAPRSRKVNAVPHSLLLDIPFLPPASARRSHGSISWYSFWGRFFNEATV